MGNVVTVVVLTCLIQGRVASRDCGEVDLGWVDAVGDAGEDGGRERQADLDENSIAVTPQP